MFDVAPHSAGIEEGAVGLEGGQHHVTHQVAQVGLGRPHGWEPPVQVGAKLGKDLLNLRLLHVYKLN